MSDPGSTPGPTPGPTPGTAPPRSYGLAPNLRARLMGGFLAAIGALLLVITLLVAFLHLSTGVLTALVVVVAAGIGALGLVLSRHWYVVRVDEIGYQVRFVRGVGEPRGRWLDVEDLATTVIAGDDCVQLRLRNGRSTTIPVGLIEGDQNEFVDELKRRLDAGHGFRRR